MEPILAFVRDQAWQFAGFVASFLAVILSIIFYVRQRQHKEVSFRVVTNTPLLEIGKTLQGKLEVLFDGQKVEQVHLVEVKIVNTGNAPLVTSDYIKPICLIFPAPARILAAEVSNTSPKSLHVSLDISADATVAQLEQVTLNARDSITVRALVSMLRKDFIVDGRFVGASELREREKEPRGVMRVLYPLFFFLYIYGYFGLGAAINSGTVAPAWMIVYLIPFFFFMLWAIKERI